MIAMKKTINVLVMEDNGYFNNLLSEALKEIVNSDRKKWDLRFSFYSFTDAGECISKIKSGKFAHDESIAFIDYYLGNGVNGTHIIKMLKDQSVSTTVVLLSQSRSVRDKVDSRFYDFFVLKDNTAPALCSLCFEQYLDNKIYNFG